LANCRIRLAVQNFQADPAYYKEAKSIIEAQIAELRLLMKTVGSTAERWSMVGSGYKRLAQLSSGKASRACDLALKEIAGRIEKAKKMTVGELNLVDDSIRAELVKEGVFKGSR